MVIVFLNIFNKIHHMIDQKLVIIYAT